MGDIDYRKEYLPGYTGHVPKKNDIYGCTAGDINRIITGKGYKPSNYDVDLAKTNVDLFSQRTFYSKPPSKDTQGHEITYGNFSKHGNNWIGGPTSNLKAQHIPGYQGYVPNIKAENIYGKSFAQSTGQAINKEFIQGVSLPVQERFQTTTGSQFNKQNFRRIKDNTDPANIRDNRDASNFQDAEFQGLEIQNRNLYLEMPTVGYQGFKSVYRPQTVSINHRKDPFFNLNPLRPRIKEQNLEQDPNFKQMTDGFKRAISQSKTVTNFNNSTQKKQPDPDDGSIKIPIAGYTGHRSGYRAQNFYGKTFRDCTIQSKFVQKLTQ